MSTRRSIVLGSATLALASRLAGKVATVSRDMHASVRGTIPIFGTDVGPADLVYGIVRGSLDLSAAGLAALARAASDGHDPDDDRALAFVSALNGVFGDDLSSVAIRSPSGCGSSTMLPAGKRTWCSCTGSA